MAFASNACEQEFIDKGYGSDRAHEICRDQKGRDRFAEEKRNDRSIDVKDYCGSLVTELSGWKAKVNDVTRKLDRVSSGDKEKVVPMVNELHMILEELDDRVERLKRDCPTQWEPGKSDLEGKFHTMKTKWEEVWKNVSPGDIGG
jgi:hypothetical protein